MRNHTDYELNVIAGKISSELSSKENTIYSSSGHSFGYMIPPDVAEKVILKYVESENLSAEDVEYMMPKITRKTKTKALTKSAVFYFFEQTWWLWVIIIIAIIASSF